MTTIDTQVDKVHYFIAHGFPAKAARAVLKQGDRARAASLFEDAILRAERRAYELLGETEVPDALLEGDLQAVEDNDDVLAQSAGYFWDAARYCTEKVALTGNAAEWTRAQTYGERARTLYERLERYTDAGMVSDLLGRIATNTPTLENSGSSIDVVDPT